MARDPDTSELGTLGSSAAADSFKSLLVGPGQGEGPSGDLLQKLEDAISRGDHK